MVNFTDIIPKKAEYTMAQAAIQHTALDTLEHQYQEITTLYDLADGLVSTVEHPSLTDAESQLRVVEPLVIALSDAADVLSESFISIAEASRGQSNTSKTSKTMIEAQLRKLYTSMHEYQLRVRMMSEQAHGAITNLADGIVQKIHRQLERVVAIFFEHISLSLQNIMNQAEIAQLKIREARIALMMHHWSQQPQQA